MRAEDISAMQNVFPEWKEKLECEVNDIGVLSSGPHEAQILKRLFPDAWITDIHQEKWDLFNPGEQSFDLILACNVFMYSSNPEKWFENVFARCKYFWLQDLIRSWRGSDRECANGPDGDKDMMRFTMPPDYLARVSHAYDLNQLRDRNLGFSVYNSVGKPGKDALSFIMFLKGDLECQPVES